MPGTRDVRGRRAWRRRPSCRRGTWLPIHRCLTGKALQWAGVLLLRSDELRLDRALSPTMGKSRSEEHTSELQSLMRISYAVFCLKKKNKQTQQQPKLYM